MRLSTKCNTLVLSPDIPLQVKKLQRQLQEEIDLHLALADAITYNAALILKSSIKLPDKVHTLDINVFICFWHSLCTL